tara:strand:+ start:2188 stop:2379 length:192 start_codon:yes stop_codon:yes gene_type:complete
MNNNLPDQYDGFATPEELNLSKEEIEELRNNKKQITEYAREKFRELAKEGILKYNDALKKLAE